MPTPQEQVMRVFVARKLPSGDNAAPMQDAGPNSDDSRLLARLRLGEERAFEELVRANGCRRLAVARRFLRNETDAQDAVQEAFASAFHGLKGFAGEAQLSTWLHRITVNRSLMKLRAKRRRPELALEDLLPCWQADGHAVEPPVRWRNAEPDQLEREETRKLVRDAIDRLPETSRNVLLLRDIEELDTRATADILGVTENAVKIRLHRARQALRELLDESQRRSQSC